MCCRRRRERMIKKQSGKTHGLVAELGADGRLRRSAVVTLVEEQVKRAMNRGKAPREVVGSPYIEQSFRCRQYFFGPGDALLDRRLTAHERTGHFAYAKTAQDVKHESDLRFLRKPGIATREHHAKLIVFDRVCSEKLLDGGGDSPFAFEQSSQLWSEGARGAFAPQHIERPVLCGGHKPRGGVLRHTTEFPHLKRTAEGVLDDVFCQYEIVDSKDARQRGDHAPRFAPKQMFVGIHHMFSFMTGRTSTAPSTSKIGQPLASSTASFKSRASTRV